MILIGRKDTLTKEYMSRNDIFADVFNYVLYSGKAVIKDEDLVDRDVSEIALPIGKNGGMVPIQRYRDVLKGLVIKESSDRIYALLGIENQSEIHYAMPVKNLLYDSLNYASQVNKKSEEYRKARKEQKEKKNTKKIKETTAEFLSGFHKGDKLKPVFTVTVYFGAEDWDAPRNIREMFDVREEHLINFLPDYFIPLIIPKEIKDFDHFQSEFGDLMHIIKASENRSEMDKVFASYCNETDKMSRTAVEILREFIGLSIDISEKEESVEMGKVCKAWEDQKKLGVEEGRKSGIAIGREEGRKSGIAIGREEGRKSGIAIGREEERKNIALQMKKEGFSMDVIARVLQVSVNSVENFFL